MIGLYLDPPANALVLCCDEKSQCQALERTQLGLPLAPKRPRTMTHDYTRHGTVTLFAALSVLHGTLIARTETQPHPRRVAALPEADRPRGAQAPRTAPDRRQLCNAQAPEGASVARRASALQDALHADILVLAQSGRTLLRRPDRRCHPRRQLRLGQGAGADIKAYLADRNAAPRPYTWNAEGAEILDKIKRARAALDKMEAA